MTPDPQDHDIVNIDIGICCNDANVDKQVVLWHFWGWRATAWVNADIKFDLWLKLKAVTFSDSLGFGLRITEAKYDISDIDIVRTDVFFVPDFLAGWLAARFAALDTQIDKPLGDLVNEEFTLLPLTYFDPDKQEVVGDVVLETELEAVINSVPMTISLGYESGANINYSGFKLYKSLIIDIKFLHGYFTGSSIDPIYDHSFYEPSEKLISGL